MQEYIAGMSSEVILFDVIKPKNSLRESDEEITRVKKEHLKLKEDTNTIIDNLVSERDEACEERYKARIQYDKIKKKLLESGEELMKAKKEYGKLKELTDDNINSLAAERDEKCEERRKFQTEYKESERKLEEFGEKTMKIKSKHRELKEDTDVIINNLIERDKAYDVYQFQEQYENIKKNQIKSEQMKVKNEDGKETSGFNDSGIEIDLNNMTKEMSKRMDTMLEEKLSKIFMTGEVKWPNNLNVRDSSCEEERTESINSYNMTTKIPETKACGDPHGQNVIIHGINEGEEVGHDAIYLQKLFDILEMGHTGPTIAHRLGMKKHDRPRPIKLTMKSINQKVQFKSKLGKLKFAEDVFKKISVTDDYTIEEREEIRRWVNKANDKNDGMKDYVWKVRGTPKTGMRLVKIRIQQ